MNPQRLPLPMDRPAPVDKVPEPAPAELPPKPPLAEPLTVEKIHEVKDEILAVLNKIFDPEIPVNIYELGLIYDLEIAPTGSVHVGMTLTSPACPVAGSLPGEVQRKIHAVESVTAVKVELVWDPPWTMARMSEAAKLQLGLDDY